MGRKVTLYIGGRKADMAEDSPVLFNWAREELDNPTVVRNSYTHQLTLPGTPANDAIFGHFSRLDRAVTPVVGQSTGIAFNPLKKADFALYGERMEVLARGYCKLDTIQRRGVQAVSYAVTLYGGLGSLFYDLTYDAQGAERTLADLIYDDGNGGDLEPAGEAMAVTAATVAALWGNGGAAPDWEDVLTFVPCYNGIPQGDFDANKALVTSAIYSFPDSVTENGVTYVPYGGAGGVMVATFQNKHSEWEMRDFRAYLQRPAVRVKAVLEALTDPRNTGEWTLALDGGWFDAGNAWWEDLWMTLPLLTLEEGQSWGSLTMADALRGGPTPAALLVGYAKTFGLVFDVDEGAKVVTLMSRDDYYYGQPVHDITFRLDRSAVDVVPVNASAKWYELAAQAEGDFCKEYADAWGRTYGSQRIDTGWEFDAQVRSLLPDSYPFKGAADVLETSALFHLDAIYSGGYKESFPAVGEETVKYKLYATQGDLSSASIEPEARSTGYTQLFRAYYNGTYNGSDAFPKVQLHDGSGKATAGSGVLLIRTGAETLPTAPNSVDARWHVSNDVAVMATLNGRPCWIAYPGNTADIVPITSMPTFRRMAGALTCDFGAPRETAVPGEAYGEGATIYYNRWRGYLADRLDWDTKVMTAKVDLRGWRPGTALMRRFFWYENSLWALNRIRDWAPALDQPTTCEFVQVRDRAAYEASQAVPAMSNWYLSVSPASITVDPSGGVYVVTITSNVSWSLTVPAWVTASAASGTGNGSVTLTATSNSGSARTGTVAFTGSHSTSASVALSQAQDFVPSISINRSSSSVDAQARTFYYQITCNGAWSCTGNTSGGWLTCTSSGSGNGTAVVGIAANAGNASRTAVLTFSMTDYPAETCTVTITQAANAGVLTYAVELGAAYEFPAAGGDYTLSVYGVTYTNGVETSRRALTTGECTQLYSGDAPIAARPSWVYRADNLGTTETAARSRTFLIKWTANGASASITFTQEANTKTQTGTASVYVPCFNPAELEWESSGDDVASGDGDRAVFTPCVLHQTGVDYAWTSGATSREVVYSETDCASPVLTVASGSGLTVTAVGSGSGRYYVMTWARNTGGADRTATVELEWGFGTPDQQTEDWTLTQGQSHGWPVGLSVNMRGMVYSFSYPRYDSGNASLEWTDGDATCYTDTSPQVGERVFTDAELTDQEVASEIITVTM